MQISTNHISELIKGITPLDVKIEAFKRGIFDFIINIEGKRHLKQQQALKILTDKETEEFSYGGAAGGAKSWTGCSWLLFNSLAYPGSKWFIGREELKRITESTLITFFKVAKTYEAGSFKYNGQKNFIQFENGSRIDLLELKYLPRDPLYERFGSTEYTGGWIEEAGEINFGAYDVLKTRIGRHYNDLYKITAKVFITCNPKKNWLYTDFYKPFKENNLEAHKKMLLAFVQDNPFIENGYIERLKRTKDKAKRERLLNGNWEYDDNPYALCSYDDLIGVFENDHIQKTNNYYLTADIARFGSDEAKIGVWDGWILEEIISFDISKTTEIQSVIEALRVKYNIPKNKCIADEDGVGGGVVDNCGIVGFKNNARPLEEKITNGKTEVPEYENLQSQCLFKLADRINTAGIYINADVSPSEKERIIQELGTIEIDPAVTKKLSIVKKARIKEDIGRSPDYRDMILMRMFFDLQPKKTVTILSSRII
ncbi:phage portal protein [Apibacter muscae]|uniref:phage terminase large subunit n=1 Tax=Apibacter muscae TaxID=2509004 RepID=UPI0011ADB480|nr:phage terminase large subunit [Apibacter muscae]TWP23124.1 phage portal protein [Apibacter muscae]